MRLLNFAQRKKTAMKPIAFDPSPKAKLSTPVSKSFHQDTTSAPDATETGASSIVVDPLSNPVIAAAKILIVDDEPSNVRLLERMLTRAQCHNFISTSDSRQALALFQQHEPDLVLTDWMMPDVDGHAVLLQLREWHGANEYLPIVVLTADMTAETKRKALSAGATDFLTKPFNHQEVLLRIGNLLQSRAAHLKIQEQNATLESHVRERTIDLEKALIELEAAQRQVVQRERLAALKAEGLSLRTIAARLGRAASTVSRELRRNALPKGGYLPVHAEGCYLERRQRPAVLEQDAKLRRFVRERLLEGWTPEQIAGWLKRGEERELRPVSTETIYAFLHRPGQKGEKLWRLLPRGRAKRGRRRARQPRSAIAERRSIHDRPAAVQKRKDAGHWEGDLLICRRTRPVLVLKERKTRFVLAARLAGKSAAETVAVMMAIFRRLDPRLRSSVTFDNDTAFARHGLLASACAVTTWFCDAYASWQKGAVENANGRLRRDLPRDLDLDALSDAELQEIVLTHNLTPRKCLGFLTPLQALLGELGKDVQIRFA